jgi:hypothetical protein
VYSNGATERISLAQHFASPIRDAAMRQCHSDAAPIRSAFMRALDGAKLDDLTRQSLWQRYRSAESSTLTALAVAHDADCTGTDAIIEDTIRRLRMPVS